MFPFVFGCPFSDADYLVLLHSFGGVGSADPLFDAFNLSALMLTVFGKNTSGFLRKQIFRLSTSRLPTWRAVASWLLVFVLVFVEKLNGTVH